MSRKLLHDTITRRITINPDQPDTDPHQCLAGPLCRAPDVTTDENGFTQKSPAITEKPDTACRRCYSAIRLAAEDLPQIHADLLDAMGDHQHVPGDKVRGTQATTLPIDTAKHDLAREITLQLRVAAARVHSARKTDGKPPRNIDECGQLIAKHLHQLITSPEQLEQDWCGPGESVLTRDPETGKPRYMPNIRVVKRQGIDSAMKLVDLRSRARARLSGITTDLWRLPAHFPGCMNCGERLYTNGHKIVCRTCDKDWTEQTGGLFNQHIKQQAELERQQRMEQLTAELAAVTEQRNTAWARLDQIQRLLTELPDVLPAGVGLDAKQLNDILNPLLENHPTPDQRQPPTETPGEPE